MDDLISVIVPVYNVEKYLKECIDSIVAQTYKNLEIILVDDGSPDNCPKICDGYARIDSRIKVIHKSNGGLSDARNTGIENAKGNYLIFIDSDDVVDITMIEKLYRILIQSNADISMCNYCYFYENLITPKSDICLENRVLSNVEAIEKLIEPNWWYYVIACNKLYKKVLWNEIRFPKGYIYEDASVMHRIFYKCKKIVVFDECLYFYRQTLGSIMHSSGSEKKLDIYCAMEDKILFLKDKINKVHLDILLGQFWLNFLENYYKVLDENPKSFKLKRAKESLRNILHIIFCSSKFTLKDKIGIFIFLINPKYYKEKFYKHQGE